MMRVAAYHRVSTVDEHADGARSELRAAAARHGELKLDVEEIGSGEIDDRPGLHRIMNAARRGRIDAIVVWKLDRFGCSALDLLGHLRELDTHGVRFIAITQGIDVRPGGDPMRLMLTVLAAVAEVEREISDRTRGLTQARRDGRGRPRIRRPDAEAVLALRAEGFTWPEVASELDCTVWAARQAQAEAAKAEEERGRAAAGEAAE